MLLSQPTSHVGVIPDQHSALVPPAILLTAPMSPLPHDHSAGSHLFIARCVFYFQIFQLVPSEAAPTPLCRDMGEGNLPSHQHMEHENSLHLKPKVRQFSSLATSSSSLRQGDVLSSMEKKPQTQPLQVYLQHYTLCRESWTERAVILALHLLRHRLLSSKGFCHVGVTSSPQGPCQRQKNNTAIA